MNEARKRHIGFNWKASEHRGMAPLGAATLSLAVALSPQVVAQTSPGYLEEVIVTAQRRAERSQDVPISITTIGGEWLGKGDVQQLSDIMKLTPGLRFDYQGALAQPTIRGVGTAVSVSGGGSNVGIYTDGFYSPNPFFADTDLLGVTSVQVLKGPQGTLFGRNSTGGAILVSTREPQQEFAMEAEAAYGSYRTQRYQAYVTGGPSDTLAFDMAVQLRKSDGFVDNIFTGSDDDTGYDNWNVRLGAKWDATDRTSVILRYSHTDVEDGRAIVSNAFEDRGVVWATAAFIPGAVVATKPDEISLDLLPTYEAEADVFQLTVRSELDGMAFTSYTQYRRERTYNLMDFDLSSFPVFHFRFDTAEDIFTQEFLLSSTGADRLQWTTGLFYFEHDSEWSNILSSLGGAPFGPLPFGNAGSGTDTRAMAAFADLTYQLTDDLFLTGGLRVSRDEVKNAYMNQADGDLNIIRFDIRDVKETTVTPRVVLRYTPTDSSSLYASYTQGYKSPLLNVGGTDVVNVDVDSEEIRAYEVGYKYAAGNMTFDIAAYYYDYKDLQVATFDGPRSIIENAADSRVYGLDAQANFAVTEALSVNLGGAWIDAEYKSFDNSQLWNQCLDFAACGEAFGTFLPEYVQAKGNRMLRAPKYTANLGVIHSSQLAGGILDLSGTLYYTSSFFFDSSEQFKQGSYELLSLRAAWTDPSDTYTLAVFGDNLTDSEYRTQVLAQQLGALSMWGMPRTFGASINVRF